MGTGAQYSRGTGLGIDLYPHNYEAKRSGWKRCEWKPFLSRYTNRPSRRPGALARRRAAARASNRRTRRGPGMAVPSGLPPGTLAGRALHVADDATLPAFGPGEGHRPSMGQRAGAGRPSIDAAAGDAVAGAETPRGQQPARPHAATPTRAPLPRSPAIYIELSLPCEGATPNAPCETPMPETSQTSSQTYET